MFYLNGVKVEHIVEVWHLDNGLNCAGCHRHEDDDNIHRGQTVYHRIIDSNGDFIYNVAVNNGEYLEEEVFYCQYCGSSLSECIQTERE